MRHQSHKTERGKCILFFYQLMNKLPVDGLSYPQAERVTRGRNELLAGGPIYLQVAWVTRWWTELPTGGLSYPLVNCVTYRRIEIF